MPSSFAKNSLVVSSHPSQMWLTASLKAITAPIGLNDTEREADLQLGEKLRAIYRSFEKTPDAAPSKRQNSSESTMILFARR